MVTNILTLNGVDILMTLVQRLLGMAVPYDPATITIQVLDYSLLVWIGSMYAPLLPFFGVAANVAQFYVKKLLALYLYTPPKERYSASRTNVIVYCLMLGLLCACSVPLVFNLQFGRRACGPHQGISMLIALGGAVLRAPRHAYTWHQTASLQHLPPCSVGVTMVVGTILTWLVSPFVLGGVAVILTFLLLVTQGQRSHFRKDREKLRNEFEQYRKQMQAKVLIARSLQKGKLIATVVKESSQGLGAAAGHGKGLAKSGSRAP
ncbi:g1422 [Coccomyxa viridis]|uniref:G1422 protein n=1 Tax=Coccomyxa viridis TaxID=1274662 RepID=A0ABP1FHZ5_9CHLO